MSLLGLICSVGQVRGLPSRASPPHLLPAQLCSQGIHPHHHQQHVCIRSKRGTIKWWESQCRNGLINITMSSGVQFSQKSIGWLGYSEPVGESHPKTRVDVISFHVALCCFPSKWMLCQAPLLCSSFGADTPLSLLLTTFQRQLCINVPAGAEIFAGTLSFQYDV